MTKAELAKKKGIKLQETQSAAEALIMGGIPDKEDNREETKAKEIMQKPVEKKDSLDPKEVQTKKTKDSVDVLSIPDNKAAHDNAKNVVNQKPVDSAAQKKGPGKPRKRKDGDRRMSFWLDEDLVEDLYAGLSYGESVGDRINEAIRSYQKDHRYSR